MEAELRELLDKQAFAERLHAYGEGIDRRDAESPESVFTADCKLPYGAYDHPARVLIDSWRADQPSLLLMTHALYVFDWSRVMPADSRNWWDAPGDPAQVGAHGPADPAWRFLDSRTLW
jgi:hypothetical protein